MKEPDSMMLRGEYYLASAILISGRTTPLRWNGCKTMLTRQRRIPMVRGASAQKRRLDTPMLGCYPVPIIVYFKVTTAQKNTRAEQICCDFLNKQTRFS